MKMADYQFPTSRLPYTDLERFALEFHRAALSYDRFHRRYWKHICRAARGRRRPGPDLGALVERLIAIIKTGEIPEVVPRGHEQQQETAENIK
jgi:hypothetical protein